MLTREVYIKEVAYHLNSVSSLIETLGKLHFFDQNIVAEHFYEKLLNKVYGYNLQNLNHAEMNSAAIDLADTKLALAVQVTSQRSAAKIKKTLDVFVKNGLDARYRTLKILIIGKRTGDYKTVKVPSGINFNGKFDVIDNDSIIAEISKKSNAELKAIHALVVAETKQGLSAAVPLRQTDAEALLKLREYFDRPALQDKWIDEVSYKGFFETIDGLIELLNTGRWEGVLITKRRFDFQDPRLYDMLDVVYHKLRNLRSAFNIHLRSGEIDLDNNICKFAESKTEESFDSQRNAINIRFNDCAKHYGLRTLPNVG
ncbi:SMEK domain-containing protein [Metapseudomonas otitidis]|uniref:SMEK domain-containing protein n=1 Tax=Metapseudomonas otitidis TaxID=319939 RepID=UPI001CA39FCF|nr:SMEK domain-containing protein [Pseudomonas otitidis]QZX85158.1 SMEK domain-containing protein [Pseudomonas otitidis]